MGAPCNQLDLFAAQGVASYGDDFDHRKTRRSIKTGERIERAPDEQVPADEQVLPARTVPNSYIAGLNGMNSRRGRKACGCDQEHNFITDREGNDVTAETCRMEDPDKPNMGDLVKPGMIIETSYDSGPYMVGQVSSYMVYGHFRCWSISVIYPDRETGEYYDDKKASWGAINELVVDWSSGEPRFGKLFKNNTDEVRIIGQAPLLNRKGQSALL